MKKTFILFGLIVSGLTGLSQTRMVLFEEFTGENCAPCASTNPNLNITLANNASKVIALKWQVPIPSAPSATWSLYRTNQAEIDWRYKSTGYGYQSQNNSTTTPVNGINSAPSGRLDGQHQWVFGLTSDHPVYMSATGINNAQAIATPFSINMSTSWSPTYTNCVVSVTIQSSSTFTAAGNLMYRLCLVERTINFSTAPGSNGEKDFYDAVRKSYPTTTSGTVVTGMGTPINGTWAAGQSQTFTVNCNIPSYIQDYGQMAFVGFIQDDGNKKVWQAARTQQPSIPNEAKALSVIMPSVSCNQTVIPSVSLKNNGSNAITALTLTPVLDGVTGADVIWTGNLASSSTTTIPMNVISPSAGAHTYSYTISGVSGGDLVVSNNKASTQFFTPTAYFPAPLTEGFTGTFPPANWMVFNLDGGQYTFAKSTLAGGYGTSSESVLFQVNSAANGDKDDMYLSPMDLTAVTAPELSFDHAYCQVATTNKDSLNIYISNNCGSTWTNIYANGATSMATAPTNSVNFFVPTASQWSTTIIPLTAYANDPQVLVRFQVRGNKGNRIFIDNINLADQSPTLVKSFVAENMMVSLYPNPASDQAALFINSPVSSEVTVVVTNAIGQVSYSKVHQVDKGSNTINLDCKNLASGIYMVTIGSAKNSQVRKLVISK
jgi:hypothetical protein